MEKRTAVEPLPEELLRGLARPEAYPLDPSARSGVRHVQTPISHVFLTGERVYKLRKAVAPGFLDFRTRALREQDCARELELNRRLAPDVYLGVARVELAGAAVRVGPHAEALGAASGEAEPCVVMRRLAEGADARSRLARGALGAREVAALVERLAAFHARAALPPRPACSAAEACERAARPLLDSLDVLASVPGAAEPGALAALRARALELLAARGERFAERERAGRRVDGHGDLHLEHVWFEPPSGAAAHRSDQEPSGAAAHRSDQEPSGAAAHRSDQEPSGAAAHRSDQEEGAEPLFIDCLEFSDALRQIDVASELAFLAMDLRAHGRADLAEALLRGYAAATDDFGLYWAVDYYAGYRAVVRAKVAARAVGEGEASRARCLAYLALARERLGLELPGAGAPGAAPLVILCGPVGSGKSSAARAWEEARGGVAIAADPLRKRLAGLAPDARGGAAAGIYGRDWTERVYAGLLERAEPVLASGRAALLDACFPARAQRAAAVAFARARGCPAWLLELRCAAPEALERLARREREGTDPSDAGPALHAQSAREFEPVEPGEADRHWAIDTDRAGWREALRALSPAASST